jgi:stress response protein SCP2
MFDIPMNTKGAMDLNSIAQGGLSANASVSQTQQYQQPFQQPQYNQQQYNQQYNAQVSQTQQYQQPVQQQQQYGQQYNTPMQQQYNQPAQQYQQPVQQQTKSIPQGNGVHLKKGQKITLASSNGGQLTSVNVCLGWDVLNQACDLDASAFMLGADGRVIGDDWFVFYGQTNSPDGSIHHSGDSTGEGSGDDEIITINLQQVSNSVQKIAFVVTIDEALNKGLNFSMVQNAYVRVVDNSTNQELSRFLLTEYYSNVTSMVVGELYRRNGEWKFNAVGDGVSKDLAELCAMYGVNVAD